MSEPTAVRMDVITKRPRTPQEQYTVMTEQQIRNVKSSALPFFHINSPEKPTLNVPLEKRNRYFRDRYTRATNEHLVRGISLSQPFGWLDTQWSRYPPEKYNTCREGAHVRWGPHKTGERTRSHFYGESVDRYTNIDMYRRNPTNQPGPITMDCGRPGNGYYSQKYPSTTTWFGSSVPLNRTQTLTLESIRPKTLAEYQQIFRDQQTLRSMRTDDWPEYSEYTDKYLLRTNSDLLKTGKKSVDV